MWTVTYWKQLVEDAIQAAATGALSVLGLDVLDVFNADWKAALGVGLGGAVLAVLKGVAVKNVGTPQTTSVVKQDESRA